MIDDDQIVVPADDFDDDDDDDAVGLIEEQDEKVPSCVFAHPRFDFLPG